jgi:hypothetical protein
MKEPIRKTLYLMRPWGSSLQAGGVDRLDWCLTRPVNVPYEDELHRSMYGPDAPQWRRWEAESRILPYRAIRKAKCEALDKAAWKCLCDTAFAGIEWDDWDKQEDGGCGDNPDAVPEDVWIGELPFLLSTEPFEGATPVPWTLTGPYSEHEGRWINSPLPEGEDGVNVWILPPRIQRCAQWEPDPFTGAPQNDFWDVPWAGCEPFLRFRDLEVAGLGQIVEACRSAIRRTLPGWNMGSGQPPLEWSATVDLWIAPERT